MPDLTTHDAYYIVFAGFAVLWLVIELRARKKRRAVQEGLAQNITDVLDRAGVQWKVRIR